MNKPLILRLLITLVVIAVAVLLGHALWKHYLYAPWTRDGRVRAEVVRVAPDVSGLVTRVVVLDNQFVHKGDVLFGIDPARFRYLGSGAGQPGRRRSQRPRGRCQHQRRPGHGGGAQGRVRHARERSLAAPAPRRRDCGGGAQRRDVRRQFLAQATWQQAQAGGHQASAAREQAQAAVEQAQVALDQARLNLERTEVRAPVDGYVTNLDVRVGEYTATGSPRLALIDSHSYYIYGYFEETKLPQLRVGDPVDIRLMAGGVRLKGSITGIARGITDSDNPTGSDLLADVNPTFNWVRLAQRVPVRIAIGTSRLPADTLIAAGMTATIEVQPRKSTQGDAGKQASAAVR